MKLKQFEDQVVTLDAGCAERSCACYSPQFGDTDGVPYYPESVVRQQQEEIVKLKLEWQYMADLTEKLQDFAIWMTGCGYDFCQHEYFIKCRDELLKGVRNECK